MNTNIVPGSLAAMSQRASASLAESFLSVDAILVVDTSGSMAAEDAPGGRSRHDAAADELARLQRDQPGRLAVIAFSDQVQLCPGGVPVRFDGGTDMAQALAFVKPADGTARIVLISDGMPDDPQTTLDVARTFKHRIDTVFIGPEGDRDGGRRFLAQLAAATGGQALRSAAPAMLGEPVKQLVLSATQ